MTGSLICISHQLMMNAPAFHTCYLSNCIYARRVRKVDQMLLQHLLALGQGLLGDLLQSVGLLGGLQRSGQYTAGIQIAAGGLIGLGNLLEEMAPSFMAASASWPPRRLPRRFPPRDRSGRWPLSEPRGPGPMPPPPCRPAG